MSYSQCKSLLVFFYYVWNTAALDLVPIPAQHPSLLLKRQADNTQESDDGLGVELVDFESFYWGGHGGDNLIYANLTLLYKDEFESIINMERFDGLLQAVACEQPMTLEFRDEPSFTQASTIWNWVNDDVNNTFVMVTERCGTGADVDRQPFLVRKIKFDVPSFKVFLDAEPKDWIDVAKNYTFHIGYAPAVNATPTLDRRGPDFTLSLASSFNRNLFHQKVSGLDLSVDCSHCGTTGRLLVDFDLDVGWKGPKLSMKVNPQDVAAFVQLTMSAEGTLSKALRWEKTLVSISIEGIKINKIGKIGAFLDIEVGLSLDEWTGEVETSFGAQMALSNAAVIDVKVFDFAHGRFSGWDPALTALPFTLGAKVAGSVQLYAQPSISLSAEALNHGLELSLDLRMPYVEIDFAAVASSSGVCRTQKSAGVNLDASAGVDLSV
ncbi:hypothetical protein B0T26DRAFT_674888 [Lasiosphaeria miniovina]|uniref:Uncharacterized protein n=1 Tax=Lasiosphaeria miniovina TaxID=1954250 RepID=A0AA40E191_9PEZI|nr:uncharacterized protein B0T26DRAFT_674888 [Lasiosphaeria miniovina]KAK0723305.1 hypothetical protein B0T26DRAFT_674888 [Lasiosphaeria miniovina]